MCRWLARSFSAVKGDSGASKTLMALLSSSFRASAALCQQPSRSAAGAAANKASQSSKAAVAAATTAPAAGSATCGASLSCGDGEEALRLLAHTLAVGLRAGIAAGVECRLPHTLLRVAAERPPCVAAALLEGLAEVVLQVGDPSDPGMPV
eukprot:364927-Chlamydomonas_euryale.AAC.13